MTDEQAAQIVHSFLTLAVLLRDEGPDAVREAALEVVETAGGDVVAALAVAAALVRVDEPVDVWWNARRRRGRPLQPHGTHAAFNRHKKLRQRACSKCEEAEREYQADRTRSRSAVSAA